MAMATDRVWRSHSLDLALVLLGVVSLVLIGIVVVLIVVSGNEPLWVLVLFPALAVVHLVTGVLGRRRRPHNRIGPIIVVGGIAWLLVSLGNVSVPVLVAVGSYWPPCPSG